MAGRRLKEPKEPNQAPSANGEAERRQLTVLFCDMVGSTRIADELGPEDWREMLLASHESVAEVVKRFDGSVAQYLGDGVLAYFGYPTAHEDDAERAVRAGLAIAEAVAARRPEFEERYECGLSVRVGIHTGPVVVGKVGSGDHQETLAVGAAINLAARVQAKAEPDTVLISAATLHLVRGIFLTDEQGPHELAGIAEPVELYGVIRATGARSRLDVAAIEELTPFVGRADELDLLYESWRRAREGRGQVVLLGGDAGMGKSRLVQMFRERLASESHRFIECPASKFHSHTAFHPLSKVIEETLNLEPERPVEEQLSQLAAGLGDMGLDPSEVVPLFASLLGLPVSVHDSPFAVTVEARRKLTLEALSRWLLALAEPQPIVLAIEDLHRLDSSSLDLLALLIHRAANAPVLILSTFRPNFEASLDDGPEETSKMLDTHEALRAKLVRKFVTSWALEPHARQVILNPLTHEQTESMLMGVTGGASLPAAIRDEVVRRTDGVPLYVEELTQSVLESGVLVKHADQYEESAPIPTFSVPDTLKDLLTARLDRLGPAKKLAHLAAVLGRDFSHEQLEAVWTDAQSFERHLSRLVSAGILQRTGVSPNASYTFKHALIQESAYESLVRKKRRPLHARVAHVMEERFTARAVAEPERLAWHCEEGGLIEKAVSYYLSAADQARQRSASSETIRHLSRGIALLQTLPEGLTRSERELVLQIELGMTLVATEGWGSRDAEAAYRRARKLCEHIGELPQVFQVMRGLITFYTARAELGTAHDLTGRLMGLAEQAGESHLLLLAHQQMGILHYFEGNPTEALEQFEQAIALYEPAEHRYLTQLHGEDLGVFARIWMAWPQWLLGYTDRAVDTSREALDLGEQAAHHFSLAYAFVWTAILHVMRREPERAREMAQRAIAISEQQGFAFLLAEGLLVVAWARLQEPLDESAMQAAVAEFQECVTRVSGTGILANAPMMIGFLADAYHRAGQYPMALGSLEAGLAISQTTGQAQWDAELHRMKGEFLLHAQANQDEVEQLFRRALEIAREKKTLSLELRAAVSLGRLWKRQGQPERARELVAPIYAQFTEGFDCPDLVDARALLAKLDSGGSSSQ
jgi:class 3 adenylate cyclase/tetratricopeptide (TPR) repeat protein